MYTELIVPQSHSRAQLAAGTNSNTEVHLLSYRYCSGRLRCKRGRKKITTSSVLPRAEVATHLQGEFIRDAPLRQPSCCTHRVHNVVRATHRLLSIARVMRNVYTLRPSRPCERVTHNRVQTLLADDCRIAISVNN